MKMLELDPRCPSGSRPDPKQLSSPVWLLLFHLLNCALGAEQREPCPPRCECSEAVRTVKCVGKDLTAVPRGIPPYVKNLFITGNDIAWLRSDSFPRSLEQLTTLNLSGNKIEVVDAQAFAGLPNLRQLDLSHNRILRFSPEAFSAKSPLQELNLSKALLNRSYVEEIGELLQNGTFQNLSKLELAYNNFLFLPYNMFSALPSLRHLDLKNNSIVGLSEGTFNNLRLETLDLSGNALKDLKNATLSQLGAQENLKIALDSNPWLCDCGIEDFLIWLRSTDAVEKKEELLCVFPEKMRNRPILQVTSSELECPSPDSMQGVLQTSYVFLGIVLALIGVIFLLVLYLNRKGIKRWIYNIRDACRDHMEGYHYRYEINTDPRLTNLSSNS
uniref:Trophoblast glycoprotein n=2 Tax=Latimeria chalumnae TaxID=7897 RepID=H3A6Q6_LATCH